MSSTESPPLIHHRHLQIFYYKLMSLRSPPISMNASRRKRTYGTKKSAVTSAAAAIFGTAAVVTAERSPLADVTESFANVNISDKDGDGSGDNDSQELGENIAPLDGNEELESMKKVISVLRDT